MCLCMLHTGVHCKYYNERPFRFRKINDFMRKINTKEKNRPEMNRPLANKEKWKIDCVCSSALRRPSFVKRFAKAKPKQKDRVLDYWKAKRMLKLLLVQFLFLHCLATRWNAEISFNLHETPDASAKITKFPKVDEEWEETETSSN